MPKRTFREAEERLETLILAPDTRETYERILDKKRNAAVADVHQRVVKQYPDYRERISELKGQLTEVEEALIDLNRESRRRDMSAAEYRERFDSLTNRRTRLLEKAGELEHQIERMVEMEEDPEGYLEDFYDRFPPVKPDFPW